MSDAANEHTYVMDKIRKLTVENKLLVERIAELEKELSYAETMSDKEQAIRDLEQQAKGLIDYAKNTYDEKQTSMYVITILEAEHLQLKAKALKEQVK